MIHKKIRNDKNILHLKKVLLPVVLLILLAGQQTTGAGEPTSPPVDSAQGILSGQTVTTWLAKAKKDGKWGYIDDTGKVVVPFQYDFAWKFSNGLAMVRKNRKNGYINKKGGVVIPFSAYHVASFHEGLARIKKEEKYGFIDRTGKIVIPCQFDRADDFSEGLARVDKYFSEKGIYLSGFIDKAGKLVIDYQYLNAWPLEERGVFREGLSAETRGGQGSAILGYIDKTGKEVIPFRFQDARGFREGLAVVQENYRWLCIDTAGKTVIKFEKGYVPVIPEQGFKEGFIRAMRPPDGLRYIDKSGNELASPVNTYGLNFSEGLAAVRNGGWGYIDRSGKIAIPFQFSKAGYFSNGLASVQSNRGKCGYIDKTGKVVIPFQFEYAWEFNRADD